jgi:hypothetical protein
VTCRRERCIAGARMRMLCYVRVWKHTPAGSASQPAWHGACLCVLVQRSPGIHIDYCTESYLKQGITRAPAAARRRHRRGRIAPRPVRGLQGTRR